MVRIGMAVLVLAVAACSSRPTENASPEHEASRFPSSMQEDAVEFHQRLENSYKSIMSSNDPEREIVEMMDRITNIYFRASGLIQKFDKEIKMDDHPAPDDLGFPTHFLGETYPKIHAAEAIQSRLKTRFLYLYGRLNEDRDAALAAGKTDPEASAEAARLSRIRKSIHERMRDLSKTEAVFAVEDMAVGMRDFHLERLSQVEASRGSSVPADLEQIKTNLLLTAEKVQAAHKKFRKRLNEKMQKAEIDRADEREIEQEADLIKADYAAYYQSLKNRLPAQSGKKIYPSASQAGNIVGGAFRPKTWVLTYDDGPHGTHSIAIMKGLEAEGYTGTFFWMGKILQTGSQRSVVEYAKSKGHILANHSQTHLNFGAVRAGNMASAIDAEIVKPERIQTEAYGYKPNFYRCPYGACTRVTAVRQALADRGYLHAFWAVDSLDWNKAANPNGASDIVARVKSQMNKVGKGVILFHDIHPQSVVASERIAKYIKSLEPQGHRVVDFCKAVDEANEERVYTFCTYRR